MTNLKDRNFIGAISSTYRRKRTTGTALALVMAVAVWLPGCASTSSTSNWRPQVDQREIDSEQYEADLAECRAYAEANPDADVEEARQSGRMTGGLLSGGAVAGSVAGTTAAVGTAALAPIALPVVAVVGGTAFLMGRQGERVAEINYRNIVTACLNGRGYSVIDAGTMSSSQY